MSLSLYHLDVDQSEHTPKDLGVLPLLGRWRCPYFSDPLLTRIFFVLLLFLFDRETKERERERKWPSVVAFSLCLWYHTMQLTLLDSPCVVIDVESICILVLQEHSVD